jgi:hypothetical protein
LVRPFLAAEIKHGVRDRRIALDAVGARPKKKIAWDQLVELEGVVVSAVDRLEGSGFAQPDILLARIARHVPDTVLREDVEDKAGAIHPPARWIGRTVFVLEIARRQLERHVGYVPDVLRIIFVAGDLGRRNRGGRSLFLR